MVLATSGSKVGRFLASFFTPDPQISPNTFVLWEPCSHSHGEIVPGYARYLLDLGFEVLVLMTPARLDEGLFSRFGDPRIHHGNLTQRRIRKLMKDPRMKNAAGVIVTTAGKLPEKDDGSIDFHRVFGPELPAPLLVVEHDVRPRVDAGAWDPNSITLRTMDYEGAASRVVNPHYFGEVRVTPKSNGRTVFVMVGAARAKRGNQPFVFDAAEELLGAGLTDFEIRIIGKPGRDPLPEKLRDNISILGRLSFSEMYEELENADFVLTSFQKDNPDHDFYRTGGTSGSFQLAYGFRKPIVVQELFARLSGFNATNALLYDGDEELFSAMKAAITMSPETYSEVQAGMEATAQTVYDQSLANLKSLING